jgi:predicted GNAT family acetyltransferase
MNLADMLRNSPLRRQRNEGQGEYDRPESYYRNQGIDGQPLPSISDRLQSMGMDSSIKDRPMLIPVREDGEWTAPEWFHSMARGAMLPAQAALGGTVTPLDTAMATADFAGGGLLSSKAIPNAVPDGAVLGATAWHGSPHKFDKFDMSKIGTGEGAQAYGHGLYAAENPKVATEYAKMSADLTPPPNRTFRGNELVPGTPEYHAGTLLEQQGMTIPKAKKEVQGWIDEHIAKGRPAENKAFQGWSRTLDTLNQTKKKSDFGIGSSENLYKLDIPDDQIAKMLDWDKPLSEQPQVLQDIARKSDLTGMKKGNRTRRMMEMWRDGTEPTYAPATGHTFYNSLSNYGQESVPELSQKLYEAGIPGIKYLDQVSRTGGQGTSNFVLFADDIAKILERNDQPIGELAKMLSGGGAKTANKLALSGQPNIKGVKGGKIVENLSDIEGKYPTAKLDLYESGDNINLSRIVLPKSERGAGVGSKIMQDITDYADKVGKKVGVTPDTTFGGTSKSRLENFYKRFGFKKNRGRNTDFSTRDSMVRSAKSRK